VAKSNFALANLLQGAGLALTFAPLATTAMGMLTNEQMGNAAGLFNLMRNLGGGVGISLVTTMIARGSQAHQATLVTHLTPYDPAFQSTLQNMQSALAPEVGIQAHLMAPGVIYSSLLKQSSLLAYVDDFRWLALLSFIAIPIVLFLKRVSRKEAVSVH
jgi:DHA2 family multidrug resistance protein